MNDRGNDSSPRPPRHGGVGPGRSDLLDFSSNINPLGPPAAALAAAQAALADTACYPDPRYGRLTHLLAELEGVSPRNVLVGNGASELIDLIARARPWRTVAIIEPTYSEYRRATRAASRRSLIHDCCSFPPIHANDTSVDLLWLGQPNNPDGQLLPRGPILDWIRSHPRTTVVVDESFLGFRSDAADYTLVPWVHRQGGERLIVLKSLTKLYALPGLRLGCLVAAAPWIRHLRRRQPPWMVNTPAAAAGEAALLDDLFLQRTHAWFKQEQPRLALALAPYADVVPSAANFFLLRLPNFASAELAMRLRRDHQIAVRDASNFRGLDQHVIRVAVRTAEENQRLCLALRACVHATDRQEFPPGRTI